jgi:hypothetical protein
LPTDGKFWSERKVAWYRRANARSNYADRVLTAGAREVAASRTALDVGAGFGALALPLARQLDRVTALEPSPAMASALRTDAAAAGLANVTVLEARWGDVAVAPHDLLVCAHVGPLLGGDSAFLAAVRDIARRAVIIVRDMPGEDDKFFFRELYPRLRGQTYESCCDYADTLAALGRVGIEPEVTVIEYDSSQPFSDLDEACDFWMEYMRLTGDEPRAELRRFLPPRLIRRGTELIAPFHKRAAVIHWCI